MTKSRPTVRLGTLTATGALAVAACLICLGAWLFAQGGGTQQTIISQTLNGAGAGGGGPLAGNVPMAPVQQSGSGLFVGQVIDADSNRPVAGAIVTLGGASAQGPVQGQRIAVSVSPGGGPASFGAPAQNPRVLTDADGRFVFQNVPKGSYNFTATKPGYVDGAYGRLRPAGTSQSIDLDDGERRGDLKVRVFRYAAISGTVTDETGEPVVGVSVRAFRRNLVAGRRLLSPTGLAATTDDRGVYRLGTLAPGEYVVGAPVVQTSTPANFALNGGIPPDLLSTLSTPGGGFSINTGGTPVTPDAKFVLQNSGRTITPPGPNARMMVYGSQYYPNATTTQQATPIVVKSGEERSGVDLSLRLVPALNISGRLVGPDGPAVNWGVHLVPGDTSDLSGDPDVATSITDADGTFMFLAIPAGQYLMQTVRVPRPQPGPGSTLVFQSAGGASVSTFSSSLSTNGGPVPQPLPTDPTLWTVMPITLANDDVWDVTLSLHAGYRVSGRVEFSGAAQKPTPDRMSSIPIVLEPADAKQKMSSVPGRVDPSGNFTTVELLPGKYLVRVGGAPSGWTFKSAMLGGVDVAETPIDLSEHDIQNVVVSFNDTPTNLSGVVRSSEGGADDAAAVVVFPADSKSWMDYGLNPRRVRLSRTSKTGAYQFGALPAGDYYVAAFSEEFAGEWQDPRFLDQLSRAGAHLTINDGEKRTQDLTRLNVRPGLDPAPAPRPLLVARPAFSGPGPFVRDEDSDQSAQIRDAVNVPVSGSGIVSGLVLLDDPSQAPIRHARVTLHPMEGKGDRLATTDDSGRFAFAGVPAGVYSLAAGKPAYVTVFYGSKHAGRGPGTTINVVKDQALTDLKLSMPHGSVITGTAVDDFGSPVPNARVSLQQFRTVNGERTLTQTTGGIVLTDDRGVYRAFGLVPGAYVVSIAPPPFGGAEVRQLSPAEIQTAVTSVTQAGLSRPTTASGTMGANMTPQPTPTPGPVVPAPLPGRPVGYSTLYYPGAWSAAEAQTVNVGVGQEVTGIDMAMHLVATARLDGVVIGADGQPLSGATILMSPVAEAGAVTIASSLRTGPDGKFSTQNLSPGRYVLNARASYASAPASTPKVAVPPGAPVPPPPPPPPPPGGNLSFSGPLFLSTNQTMTLWAQQEVDVNGEDVTGVTLVMHEGVTLSGKVLFDGRVPPPAAQDLTKISVQLRPDSRNNFLIGVPPTTIDVSGTFTVSGIAPGKYRLTATVPGATSTTGWQLRSAVIDGRDAVDIPIEIKAGQNVAGAVLTFSDLMAELSGRLLDASGHPAPGLTVLLFPTDRTQWLLGSRRMPQPILPSNDGKFRATGLPAGEYFLAAVTDLDQQDWGDPVFMEQVVPGALKITLGEGERKTQDLRVAAGGSSEARRQK
jgi:protocatechuate 3,4-dioxygenase beta subunit